MNWADPTSVHLLIVELHQNKCRGRSPANFASPWVLCVMLQARKNGQFSTSESQSSCAALGRSHLLSMGTGIVTIRQHGWHLKYLRSKFSGFESEPKLIRWVKHYNKIFRDKNWKVCLWLDNFSGHKISYRPTNIHLEMFEPNMTSFV